MGMDCLARWWSHIPGGVFEDGQGTPYSGQVDKVVFGLRVDLISEVFSNLIGFVVEEVVKWKHHHFSLNVMGSLSLFTPGFLYPCACQNKIHYLWGMWELKAVAVIVYFK